LSPDVLARYAGTYEVAPKVDLLVMLVDGRLMGQMGQQKPLPLFAETETIFFLKAIDAQLEFVKDDRGNVTHVITRQGGRDQKAPRK
jgi:hypothetical protein